VHTDVQALANALDTVPLFPQAKTTSFSAAAGFSYAAGTGVTATLPASPATGDTIRVAGSATVTGVAPAVVAAAGGKGINGLGLAAASSFKLGLPWAHATLQYDGTNWQIIDGGQDTGWVAISLTSGWDHGGSAVPQARLRGDVITLRGWIRNFTGSTAGQFTNLATLPTGITLYSAGQLIAGLGGTMGYPIQIYNNAGITTIQVWASGGWPNGTIQSLDSISFSAV
jgi:hypothetical protein